MMNLKIESRLAAAGAALALSAASAVAQTQVIYYEGFEGVALGPNVMEGIQTGSGGQQTNVWTPDFPTGWDRTFSCPGDGVTEWQGWHLADTGWWSITTGNQRRQEFEDRCPGAVPVISGSGNTAAIADGDEWDDFNRTGACGPDEYDASMVTPEIDLTGVAANSMVLNFHSSWRDEPAQEATVEVSFDGGASYSVVLRWSSDPNDPDFHDDFPLEVVSVPVNNPAGGTAQFRFRYFNADNNWWWAVDDITVLGDASSTSAAPLPMIVTADTFNITATPTITYEAPPFLGGAVNPADDFEVIFAKDAAFSNVVFSATTTDPSGFTLPGGAVPNGIYYVRVDARNGAGTAASCNAPRIAIDNPCFVDLNGDGNLDIFDFLRFQDLFVGGCP